MDHERLKNDIAYVDRASEYWTELLMTLPEILLSEVDRKTVPQTPGLYVIRHENTLQYIGQSGNLRTRICSQHLAPRKRSSTVRRKVSRHINSEDELLITVWLKTATIAWLELGHHGLTLAVEHHAITKHKPPFNGYM